MKSYQRLAFMLTLVLFAGFVQPARADRVDDLIKQLGAREPEVRRESIEALQDTMDRRAIEPLVTMLRDEDVIVQAKAAMALGRMGKPAMAPLIAALKNEEPSVRLGIASASKLIGSYAVESLIAALNKNKACSIRAAAAWVLGTMGEDKAVKPLIATLKDWNWKVREHAAEALAMIKDPRAINPLVTALREWGSRRYTAAAALTTFGRPAVKALTKVSNEDPDPQIRNDARWILEKIGKEK